MVYMQKHSVILWTLVNFSVNLPVNYAPVGQLINILATSFELAAFILADFNDISWKSRL